MISLYQKKTLFVILLFLVLSPLILQLTASFAYEPPEKERYYVSKENGYIIENNRRLTYERYDEILLKDISVKYNESIHQLNASYLVFNPGERGLQGEEQVTVYGSNFDVNVVKTVVDSEEVITGLQINYYFFRAPISDTYILSSDVTSSLKKADFLITKFNTSESRIYIAFQYSQWNGEQFENVFVELSTDNDASGLVEKIGVHFIIENQEQRPIQESHLTIRQMTYYEQYIKSISIIRLIIDLWLVWLSIGIFVVLVIGKKRWHLIRKWLIITLGGEIRLENHKTPSPEDQNEKTSHKKR